MRRKFRQLFSGQAGSQPRRKEACEPPTPAPSSTETPAEFYYESIAPDEIRLLTIAPSPSQSQPLHCYLTSHRRNEHPGYAAISYTWGDASQRGNIECNGKSLGVTQNCEAALRALRDQAKPRTVWIDAVCINQEDSEERRFQVANMGEVFRLATVTFVYLGESDRRWSIFDQVPDLEWQGLLNRPWFSRTWVIQELLLSREVIVVIGLDRMAWKDFLAFCEAKKSELHLPTLMTMRTEFSLEYARRPPKGWDDGDMPGPEMADDDDDDVLAALSRNVPRQMPSSSLSPTKQAKTTAPARILENVKGANISRAGHSDQERSSKETGQMNLNYWRLPDILEMTHEFKCQDPRDALFAILPLFSRPIPNLLHPDYQKTPQEVFADLSWFLIEQGNVTAFRHRHQRTPTEMSTPSWVMYWPASILPPPSDLYFEQLPAKAGFGSAGRDVRAKRVGTDGSRIQLRGLIVGVVNCLYHINDLLVMLPMKLPIGDLFVALTTVAEQTNVADASGYLNLKWTWLITDVQHNSNEAVEELLQGISNRVIDDIQTNYSVHAPEIQASVKVNIQTDADETYKLRVKVWCPSYDFAARSLHSAITLCCQERYRRRHYYDHQLPKFIRTENSSMSFRLTNEDHDTFEHDVSSACSHGTLRHGDIVCVLLGSGYPVAMRKSDDEGHFELIGECRVAKTDVMEGRLLEEIDPATWWAEPCPGPLQDFVIA
ncbi:hypothetical protein M409DRAFT_53209 [Zasmidium cellare ATCC 36951]|uniref:Heterokaryon incompatibility domain-containing protein n=1 Tax=Zasmidium cellare ATCC 36951 TaxID=1080233 RepID=A0A6A6CND1_ZASCE|nr:uncharacterized protein M409DRAFT_53209 [Zasmidium cellare ATCC 36951]KAF2168551.1 hypothetical protein M409DRAFT_53209 [Zasmidium cellare ATCC 36951]